MNNLLILAIYLDISGCLPDQRAHYIEDAGAYFKKQTGQTSEPSGPDCGEIITIIIPVDTETRIECVYPVFATDEKLEEMLARSVQAFKDMLEND